MEKDDSLWRPMKAKLKGRQEEDEETISLNGLTCSFVTSSRVKPRGAGPPPRPFLAIRIRSTGFDICHSTPHAGGSEHLLVITNITNK